jgi:hypothetical protein
MFIGKKRDVKSETTSLGHPTESGYFVDRVEDVYQVCLHPALVEGIARWHMVQHSYFVVLFTSKNLHGLFSHLVFTTTLSRRRMGDLLQGLLPVSSDRQQRLPGAQMPSTAVVPKPEHKA